MRCDGAKERYVGLGSSSRALLLDAQKLLSTFGVFSRVYETRKHSEEPAFTYARKDGTFVAVRAGPMFDLRITGRSMERFADALGFSVPTQVRALDRVLSRAPVRYAD